MVPNAPMMPSLGLATTAGAGSGGRRPARSSRVKQSCRLVKLAFLASERSRSENSRQQAIDMSRTIGFSILLNQPMKRVRAARGMRLVNRKLRSSCSVREEMRLFTVMNLSAGLVSACHYGYGFANSDSVARGRRCRHHGRGCPQGQGAAGAVPCQASLADRTLQDVAPD